MRNALCLSLNPRRHSRVGGNPVRVTHAVRCLQVDHSIFNNKLCFKNKILMLNVINWHKFSLLLVWIPAYAGMTRRRVFNE
jgi:hypothetical protein